MEDGFARIKEEYILEINKKCGNNDVNKEVVTPIKQPGIILLLSFLF